MLPPPFLLHTLALHIARSVQMCCIAVRPTCTLSLWIPHIVKAQAKKAAKQATLTCPVSAPDQL